MLSVAVLASDFCPLTHQHPVLQNPVLAIHQDPKTLKLVIVGSPRCIFEIAAYRRANPQGRIVMAPIFVETVVFCMWACMMICAAWIWMSAGFILGEGGFFVLLALVVCLTPVCVAIHLLRRTPNSKHVLLEGLSTFDLQHAHCRLEHDRLFVRLGSCSGSRGRPSSR